MAVITKEIGKCKRRSSANDADNVSNLGFQMAHPASPILAFSNVVTSDLVELVSGKDLATFLHLSCH